MRIVRRHLVAASLLLLALQGTGLVAVAQPGIGSSAGSSCTCECCRNTPGAHCPMCARARAGHCDCSARGTGDAALPWVLDFVALLPAAATVSQPPALGRQPLDTSRALSDESRRPPVPPPRSL